MYTEGHLQITYKYYIILHKELENPQILASEVGKGPGTNRPMDNEWQLYF